ncbi:hypothetical protein BaRGS_00013491 [Batillaria attramentaria]|uniref:PA domain-containing protein n=1 Tax=Batillaria attramentaria TaxID=370345 RepID=A0ABD0L878_9CAEN
MLDGQGRPMFTSKPGARTGCKWDNDVTWPYCFYSPSGQVQGKLIYASYGRPQDFRTLEKMGVDTANAVVFIRYGKISRGRKRREATKRGASAVVLYNDPADVSVNMTYHVFPATWWLPGDDVEHGNIRTTSDDALRVPLEDMHLPTTPCHPVGYDDARVLYSEPDV